jgi:hypothetical protein
MEISGEARQGWVANTASKQWRGAVQQGRRVAAAAPLEQWRGAVEAALPGTPAGAAWAHVASFFSAHRYLPGIDVCERVAVGDGAGSQEKEEDDDGHLPTPGCVRHVASSATGLWAREELLEADHAARRLRYAVVASNMGFGRYVATVRVLDDGDLDGGGCRISWAFECDAVRREGWSEAALVARLGASVEGMAERVQRLVAQ